MEIEEEWRFWIKTSLDTVEGKLPKFLYNKKD